MGSQFRRITTNVIEKPPVVADISGTYNLCWCEADLFALTVTGNVTITFSDMYLGMIARVLFRQDAVGGHTVTLPEDVMYPDGSPITFNTGPLKDTLIDFLVFDNTSEIRAIHVGLPAATVVEEFQKV